MAESDTQAYVIGINDTYMHAVGKQRIQELFDEMYAPLGIQPELRFFPSKRALQMANRGDIDAEAGRVTLVAAQYKNLLVVPEAMIRHEIAFFCLQQRHCQKGPDLRIGMIRGFRFGPHYCKQFGLDCLFDQSHGVLVSALQNNAIDVIVGSRTSTLHMLCKQGISEVYYRPEPDAEVLSFHLVHKRHQDKVEAISASIRVMHKKGLFLAFDKRNAKLPDACDMQVIPLA